MFAVTPYSALRYVARLAGDTTTMKWEPCRVIGVDASKDDPQYIVEIRSAAGDFYLESVDSIRKPAPSA
jgi:hypothetical protein